MSEGPSPEVLAAMQGTALAGPSEDKLTKLREAVAKARELEAVKRDMEERLKQTNIALQTEYFKTLPDLMDEIGVPSLTLAAEGNFPGVVADVGPYYRANIPADWPPEKRAEAFRWLDANGHGDLIKTEVILSFAREDRPLALAFQGLLQNIPPTEIISAVIASGAVEKFGGDVAFFQKAVEAGSALPNVASKETIPWATLTSWPKEQVEKIKIVPPLETLGATVGRVVKLKPTKD